jgi:protein-tyrosine sulfotransferase
MRFRTKRLQRSKYALLSYTALYRIRQLQRLIFVSSKVQSIEDIPPPFFIVGCGRSGTTLLRAMLLGSTQIGIPPESGVIGPLAAKWKSLNVLSWEDQLKVVLFTFQASAHFKETWRIDLNVVLARLLKCPKDERSLAKIINSVFAEYCDLHHENWWVWGDKTPLNTDYLPLIDKVYPQANYIHLVRDGRDVAASLYGNGLNTEGFTQGVNEWVDRVSRAEEFGLKVPAERFLTIRYEDLVREPDQLAHRICNFLKIDYTSRMLKPEVQFSTMGDTTILPHHQNNELPINVDNIGKWKKSLNDEQKVQVEEGAGFLLRKYNYL